MFLENIFLYKRGSNPASYVSSPGGKYMKCIELILSGGLLPSGNLFDFFICVIRLAQYDFLGINAGDLDFVIHYTNRDTYHTVVRISVPGPGNAVTFADLTRLGKLVLILHGLF